MALIPEKPTKRAALLIFVIVGAGLYFFYDSWYTPQREDADAMQARLEQLESANRRAQIVAARGSQDLIERLALYERHVATLETLIPQSHEVPALLNNMAMEARRSDIDLALMRPEPAETGTFYTKRSYEIGVIGEYHDVGRFLTSVASLPRIITPVDLDLVTFEGDEQAVDYDAAVTARFRIQTYVLPGPGEVPPDVPQPEQPGAVSE
jgi:type IV pilus assembly protein PilO